MDDSRIFHVESEFAVRFARFWHPGGKIKEKHRKMSKHLDFPYVFLLFYAQTLLNSRGVNSRELFWFFGHNSAPRQFWGVPLGGNSSYKPPGAS